MSDYLKFHEQAFLLRDFRTFAKHSGMVPDYREQPHDEMCDELEMCVPEFRSRRQKKKIYLAPRGSYKTSLIKAFIVYLVRKFPNIRIVYGRADANAAMAVLRSIKDAMKNNPTLVRLWGDPEATASIWSESQFVLARPNSNLTDPTVETTAIGQTLTGKHPDIVILDDLVTDMNYRSELVHARSRTLVDSVYPVLEPWGSVVLSGTRWAHNDVYGWVMAQDAELHEKEGLNEWTQYIRAVEENGVYFFPDVLSKEFIDQQRRSLRQNLMLFSSWYYNSPEEIGTKLFPKHYFRYLDAKFYRSPGPHLETADGKYIPLYVTMTVDPAPTIGKYADFTGFTVVGTDHEGQWYVLWAEDIKRIPSDAARHMLDVVRVFGPSVIGIETGQADPTLVARLQDGIRDLESGCSIQSYSALQNEAKGQRSKDARVEALEPLFRNGNIIFIQGVPIRSLLQQLDGYGALDHDDVVDALSMQRTFVRRCKDETFQDQTINQEDAEERDSWGPEGKPVPTKGRVKGTRVDKGPPLRV